MCLFVLAVFFHSLLLFIFSKDHPRRLLQLILKRRKAVLHTFCTKLNCIIVLRLFWYTRISGCYYDVPLNSSIWSSHSPLSPFYYKATPHNSRRPACFFLFRQLAQKISARRQPYLDLFEQPDEKSCCAIRTPELCGIALNSFINVYPFKKHRVILCLMTLLKIN